MLDVERGVDVDAAVQQLLHVLPPLGMPDAGALLWASSSTSSSAGCRASAASRSNSARVVVRYSTWRAGRRSRPASKASVSARPCVSTQPMTTSTCSAWRTWAALEHGVGLAHAGRRAQEDLEPPVVPAALGGAHLGQERIGVGSAGLHGHARLFRLIEGEVEREDIHARLAEDAELPPCRMGLHQSADRLSGQVPGLRHAPNLVGAPRRG